MESSRDEVRVMTVHGAKGLEAPIVFLVDGGMPYAATHQPDILGLSDTGEAPFIWKRGGAHKTNAQSASLELDKQTAMAEYYRLLYVAMTRARDRLYVVSTGDKNGKTNKDGWFTTVFEALSTDEHCQAIMNAEGVAERWRWQMSNVPAVPDKEREEQTDAQYQTPDWLNETAPEQPSTVTFISPSNAFKDAEFVEVGELFEVSGASADTLADIPPAERGTLMHRLLERLPALAPNDREAVANRYLGETLPDVSEESRSIIAREVLAVLSNAETTPLFQQPSAQAEVTVSGAVDVSGKTLMVRGQIDRLIVAADHVHIVDFKTHRTIPIQGAERRQIERQMALYQKLLQALMGV